MRLTRSIFFLLLIFMPFCARAAETTVEPLAWLTGAWVESKAGVETEEHWIAPKGGVMLGVNRTTRANGKTSFEFLRLAMKDGKVVYFASPGGKGVTEFALKESGAGKVVFENLAHDFPQRIVYTLEGDLLTARIEGTVQGQPRSMGWSFRRATAVAPLK